MTLSISDQPSQWHRVTARHSLLSDATIDPFPYRTSRTASLLDHHIVRDQRQDAGMIDNGRRGSVPYLPPVATPIAPPPPPPPPPQHLPAPPDPRIPPPLILPDQFHDPESRKRSIQMASQDHHSEESSSPTSIGHIDGSSSFCLCQPEPKIPRPRNAFILYRQHQQAAVVRANPGLPNPAISKIIGEQWTRLPEDAKGEWKALAEEEKARHAQQYPDYRYQPRRNGRYSSQSSGSGPPSGGKVDEQGNCVKCGGKTMNPPTTPYVSNPYPTTPRGSAGPMPRPGSQAMVSPPQSGRPPYADRHWPPPPPPRYHDPRQRYPSVAEGVQDGPDMKRRRFDGNGIYIPTREWREGPYQYSPRGTYFRGEVPPPPPPNVNHRPSMTGPPPPHAMYPGPNTQPSPPKLQLARPPHPQQHKRDPSLTLAPLSTTATKPSTSSNSGLEAMIMSIPVINKVKILSQISPYLPPPSLSSPMPEVRGSVVAIEGMDPTTVYSMTNSLAEELEKDGKFAVRIFGGPDPYSVWSSHGKQQLNIADTLSVIGEWHKISEEMKRFITTKFSSGSVSDSAISVSSTRKSVSLDESEKPAERRPSHEGKAEQDKMKDLMSPSLVSPKTLPASVDQRSALGNRHGSFSNNTDADSRPFSRIPAAAQASQSHRPSQDATVEPLPTSTPLNTVPPPLPTPTATTNTAASSASPTTSAPATTPALSTASAPNSASPIPIALVPHYQLTTVDTAAITLPISDSYSPLAHWQWLATLWRGCIGPDVSIIIKGGNNSSALGSIDAGFDAEKVPNNVTIADAGLEAQSATVASTTEAAGTPANKANVQRPSISVPPPPTSHHLAGPASGSSSTGPPTGPSTSSITSAISSVSAPAAEQGIGQGVDVRLLECRAVVVRMGGNTKESESEKEKGEFWEKAKRRVGFEVGEFLRR